MKTAAIVALFITLSGCTAEDPAQPAPPLPAPETSAMSDPPASQPRWDPRAVDALPAADSDVVPGLPAAVDPPAVAPLLETRPMDAAVLSVDRRGRRFQLLGVDGSWREVRTSERYPRGLLSPDGTRFAALLSDGIELWLLPTGERITIPLPAGYRPWDFSSVGWIDRSTLLLDDYGGGWRIDIESGAAERTPYPRWNSSSWVIDDDGAVLEIAGPSKSPALLDWSGGSARRVELPGIGHLQRSAVRGDAVVGTTYDERGFAVVSLDRSDPAATERLPVHDFEGNYSNWAMHSVAVLDDGSALFWVAVPGRPEKDGWRLVRWTPGTDRFEVVTTSEADPTWPLTFARDLVVPEQGPWDPRDVDDLSAAADDVAPLLPEVLDLPDTAPALAHQPIEAAVLSLGGDDAVYLRSVDGSWRSVPPPRLAGSVALNRDGTRLAMETETGVDIWDLATGTRVALPLPSRYRPADDSSWSWLDNHTLLLEDGGGWRVDVITGAAQKVPYPRGPWVVDDRGAVVETDWENVLTDWASGEPRRLDMSGTGRLQMFQASSNTIAGTASRFGRPLSVYVVDRSDLAPRHVLPVRDPSAGYANGGLSVLALLDDGTVLLRLLVLDHSDASVRLVAWDPVSGELSLVTRSLGVLPDWSVAADLLG
jgi:hypothetical protein